ncbi:membrane-associated protein, putative [Bodo saltans]|uniref:Membrane-associated protein, putative n=1 Tax=Bodo saltans TaxID=75058 RepID=A0A0S4JC33_BODSA|nr:membrane-associated protein, putative [Bodo saltans]|eukprot:CUG87537.1 membrane-associated protein, putative [Bodo saltans]
MKAIFARAQAVFASSRYATMENGTAFIAGAAIIPITLAATLHLSTAKALPSQQAIPMQNGRTEGSKWERRAAAPTLHCSIFMNDARMHKDRAAAASKGNPAPQSLLQ